MVVVTGQNKVSATPDDAMSSSDAEDDFQEPATPTATQAGQALPLLPQQVRAHLRWECRISLWISCSFSTFEYSEVS